MSSSTTSPTPAAIALNTAGEGGARPFEASLRILKKQKSA
jgi:hypothetical protein